MVSILGLKIGAATSTTTSLVRELKDARIIHTVGIRCEPYTVNSWLSIATDPNKLFVCENWIDASRNGQVAVCCKSCHCVRLLERFMAVDTFVRRVRGCETRKGLTQNIFLIPSISYSTSKCQLGLDSFSRRERSARATLSLKFGRGHNFGCESIDACWTALPVASPHKLELSPWNLLAS